MGQHVVLLGDSIFDNAAYVQGGPAVIDQLRERLADHGAATLLATDGSMINDVHWQIERLPDEASHLVLSVGGNDALNEIGVLGKRVGTVGEGIRQLADVRDRFELDYRRLLDALRTRGLATLVCTIYSPRFPDHALQREAVAALCLFNDCILRLCHEFRRPVLDLRTICTSDEDYANPIEPSSAGGAKIAQAISDIVSRYEFDGSPTVLLP